MTKAEKGTKGEQLASVLLIEHGIKFKQADWGTGPDFVTDAGITIDAKYSSAGASTQMVNGKIYSQKIWRFNLHHHGVPQNADFYIFILEDAGSIFKTFVFPLTVACGKTFNISETQIETRKYAKYENNFGQITGELSTLATEEKGDEGKKMKAIIQGKRYDTDKAVLIGEGQGPAESRSDFSWWEAGLYRTPVSRQYFLAGAGGPMTQFGRATPDGSRGYGEKLIPLTHADAFRWAQEHLADTEVEQEFGALIEDA